MKRNLPPFVVVTLFLFLFLTSGELFSQTTGTFSFSVTTTAPSGNYGTKNVLAIWIQNSAATFIKTKIRYSSNSTVDHLDTWILKSGQNVTDATTGATRTAHGTVTFLWNGTNVAGTVVPDGTYFTWLEMAWDDNPVNDKTVNSFPFTKGPTASNPTTANTSNFLNLSLSWVPSTTGLEDVMENKDIAVYPNPSTGLVNLNFKESKRECLVEILNMAGRLVYKEKMTDLQSGIRTLDLTGMPAGIYYCTLHFPDKDIVFSILLAN